MTKPGELLTKRIRLPKNRRLRSHPGSDEIPGDSYPFTIKITLFVNLPGPVSLRIVYCNMEPAVSFKERLYKWKIHHVVFWLAYFVFWSVVYRDEYESVWLLVFVVSIYLTFHASPFYIINYYLIPAFLKPHRVLVFVALTLVILAGASFSLAYTLHWLFPAFRLSYALISGFSSVCIMAGGLTMLRMAVDKIRSDRKTKLFEENRTQAELQYLRAQVNPHFLFNSINSIHVLIRKDPEKAADTLIKLSELLRFQLYECTDEKIAIESELNYIRNFIILEELRRGSRIQINMETEGALSGFEIAPFLSVPFLENAFKFVSSHSDKLNEVRIQIKRTDNNFEATFYNTRDQTKTVGVGGIGLRNVERRLELLYPGKHKIVVEDKPEFWRSTLYLTLS